MVAVLDRDENNQLYKITRLDIATTPPLLASSPFVQRLNLTSASVDVHSGDYLARVFVDATSPTLQVSINRTVSGVPAPFQAAVTITPLRVTSLPEPPTGVWFCKNRTSFPDTVVAGGVAVPVHGASHAGISLYHRNEPARTTLWRDTLELQGLSSQIPGLVDPVSLGARVALRLVASRCLRSS